MDSLSKQDRYREQDIIPDRRVREVNIFTSMAEKIKTGIRTWLHIQPAVNGSISIQETLDYEGNAIKNKIW